MMIKIFLISAFIATSANAGWVWKDDINNPSGDRVPRMAISTPQFPHIVMPDFSDFPARLALPSMPNFADLFARHIKIPDMKQISQEIASHKGPGYTGVSMISTSDGGTIVTMNKDGKTETRTYPAGSSNTKTSSVVVASNN